MQATATTAAGNETLRLAQAEEAGVVHPGLSEGPMNVSFAKGATTAKTHVLQSRPETIHWGFFDGGLEPVLTIDSGDRVVVETVSGNAEWMPAKSTGFEVLPELKDIHLRAKRGTATTSSLDRYSCAALRSATCLKRGFSISSSVRTGATICSGPTWARCPRTFPTTASFTSRSITTATWLFCLPG